MNAGMMRVRLKADGRIVEVLADGSERALTSGPESHTSRTALSPGTEADYVRGVRARTGLTQTAFAARIGVPVETLRNWEQGKRLPRGPARALLKLVDREPEVAFSVLGPPPAEAFRTGG